MGKERPDWHKYFFGVVEAIAARSTCDRGRSGALIVKDRQIVSAGYVGAAVGMPHCDEVGHLMQGVVGEDGKIREHCVRTVHAEANAIAQAAKRGVVVDGAVMYTSMVPCWVCANLIVQSGIIGVLSLNDYWASARTKELFRDLNIDLVIVNPSYRYKP